MTDTETIASSSAGMQRSPGPSEPISERARLSYSELVTESVGLNRSGLMRRITLLIGITTEWPAIRATAANRSLDAYTSVQRLRLPAVSKVASVYRTVPSRALSDRHHKLWRRGQKRSIRRTAATAAVVVQCPRADGA